MGHCTTLVQMQKYVDQLLQDIAAATRPPQPTGPGPEELDAYFEEVDRYLEDEPEQTLGQHCGLHAGPGLSRKACSKHWRSSTPRMA